MQGAHFVQDEVVEKMSARPTVGLVLHAGRQAGRPLSA